MDKIMSPRMDEAVVHRVGTDVNDAILAATAIQNGGCIYTLNTRHYPMQEVTVKRAWRTPA
jgi:predicted nucleic acid-binding protein